MFYLTYVKFLLAGHSSLLAAIGADSWGAARSGVALDSSVAHGRIGGGSRGRGSHGAGGSHGGGGSSGAKGSRGGGV
jgi:hypothetical protein